MNRIVLSSSKDELQITFTIYKSEMESYLENVLNVKMTYIIYTVLLFS